MKIQIPLGVSVLLVGISLCAATKANTDGEFMAALEANNVAAKQRHLDYFNGQVDALMYANESLIPKSGGHKLVCFPAPIPGRKVILEQFMEHISLAVEVAGMERIARAQVDQIIYASWMRNYPCRK
jgi:hypothetical protein